MSNSVPIQDSTILVTGANRGIGAALVRALVEGRAKKVYAAMRRPEDAAAVSDPRVIPLALDVTDADQVAWAAAQCGDVNIVINNAGVLGAQSLLARGDAGEHEMRVNYFGTLRMCQAFAPVVGGNGGGAIVNILSILSLVSSPRIGSYAASKAAALSMTQGLRGELAAQGTLVVGVLPGFVDTDMARDVPFPKLTPDAVAAAVIEAIEAGVEDVYPGEAATIARELHQDPKAVERRFAAMFAAAAH